MGCDNSLISTTSNYLNPIMFVASLVEISILVLEKKSNILKLYRQTDKHRAKRNQKSLLDRSAIAILSEKQTNNESLV